MILYCQGQYYRKYYHLILAYSSPFPNTSWRTLLKVSHLGISGQLEVTLFICSFFSQSKHILAMQRNALGATSNQKEFAPCPTGQTTERRSQKRGRGGPSPTCTIQGPEPHHLDGGPMIACILINSNLGAFSAAGTEPTRCTSRRTDTHLLAKPSGKLDPSPLSNLILGPWLQWWIRSKP